MKVGDTPAIVPLTAMTTVAERRAVPHTSAGTSFALRVDALQCVVLHERRGVVGCGADLHVAHLLPDQLRVGADSVRAQRIGGRRCANAPTLFASIAFSPAAPS